jgi:hypothetical protein
MMTASQTSFQMNSKWVDVELTCSFSLLCLSAQLKKSRQARGSSEKAFSKLPSVKLLEQPPSPSSAHNYIIPLVRFPFRASSSYSARLLDYLTPLVTLPALST